MEPERWSQVKQIVNACLEMEPGKRKEHIKTACTGDPTLIAEVESLLNSYDEVGDFLATSALGGHPETLTGRRIGSYQISGLIARGGMGAVYKAVRADDQYHQQVAIKLILGGFDSDFIIRRFKAERQILANLDHPNIARLLDGGTTEEGRPYLVMEYVQGQPIDAYCDARRLSTDERLKLFRVVCSAVQFAHQNLVIHRDLKPGNILVTAEGVPKLLDFGIAKISNPEQTAEFAERTATFGQMMTLEYASPEQVRGGPFTTATDVYSLGVVLYRLLTGHWPYRTTGQVMHEIVRAVCEQEPEKPSTAIGRVTPGQGTITPGLVSSMRSVRLEKLRSHLAGDLDNILLKALRKEPDRRYASVEQFSEDIRRYLGGLPVIARKGTLAYRAGKFVRRHKTGLAAAVLVMFGLIAGIIVTLREARIAHEQAAIARAQRAKAEQRFSDVRKLANSLMFEMHDAIQDLPGATHARELLVKRASEYLDKLAAEASGDESLQNELATAYEKVGDIQASTGSESVGNTQGAEESYRKAVKIREALTSVDPSPKARTGLALISSKLASVLESKGDFTEAVQIDRRAVAMAEELYPADPRGNANRLAVLTVRLGYHLYMKGDWTESEKMYQRGIQVLEIAKAANAGGKITEYNLGFAYMKAGKLALRQARWEQALQDYQKSMAVSQAWLTSSQKNVRAQLNLAYGYLGIGDSLTGKKDFAAALANYRKAEAIANSVAKADPNDARAGASLGDIYGGLAGALGGQGNLQAALRYHQAAVSAFEKQHAADPSQADIQRSMGDSSAALGDAYLRLATKPGTPKSQQVTYWRNAQSSYKRSLEAYSDLRSRGALASPVANQPGRVAHQLSICAEALTRLGAVSASAVSK